MSYNEYLKMRKQFQDNNKRLIEHINHSTNIPQNVLLQKEVAELLETDEATFKKIDDKFYFTEKLVNKLMWFSYLKGCEQFVESSYQKGWDDCLDDVKERLEL